MNCRIEINPLDPHHAKAGPIEPRVRRKLMRIAGLIRRPSSND